LGRIQSPQKTRSARENESSFGLGFNDTIDDGYPVNRTRKFAIGEGGIECRAGFEALSDGFVERF
jgi:hypothetical protein